MCQKRDDHLDAILEIIQNANDDQINIIIDAITRRYNQLFPEWEILFLSMPKDRQKRNAQLSIMLEQLKMDKLG